LNLAYRIDERRIEFKLNFRELIFALFRIGTLATFLRVCYTIDEMSRAIFTTRWLAMPIAISSYIGKTRGFYSLYTNFYSFSADDTIGIICANYADERLRRISAMYADDDGPNNRARAREYRYRFFLFGPHMYQLYQFRAWIDTKWNAEIRYEWGMKNPRVYVNREREREMGEEGNMTYMNDSVGKKFQWCITTSQMTQRDNRE